MPIQHRIYPHKLRPAFIRGRETRQELAMGICSPRAHEYRLDIGLFFQVYVERLAHRQGVSCQVEMVFFGGCGYKVLDFLEGVWRCDVDALETRECLFYRGRRGGGRGGLDGGGPAREDKD